MFVKQCEFLYLVQFYNKLYKASPYFLVFNKLSGSIPPFSGSIPPFSSNFCKRSNFISQFSPHKKLIYRKYLGHLEVSISRKVHNKT